jgi:hypothetical protein
MTEPVTLAALPRSSTKTSTVPLFVLTALNSMSTGIVVTGIFFVTRQGYGFDQRTNYALGALLGAMYIVGAFAAGPVLTRLHRAGASTRAILAGVILLLAACTTLPSLFPGTPAAIWWLVALYSPASGALWPIVESYVSGGRVGADLQQTIGRWNVTWSAALVVASVGIAPLCEPHPALAILLLGGAHVLSLAMLPWLTREPAPHVDALGAELDVDRVTGRKLLAVFRILLPLHTLLMNALTPTLPGACARLGVPAALHAMIATGWLLPRSLTFWWLAHRPGWHGSKTMPIVGGAALLAGFVTAVLAPASATFGLPLLLVGLASFGAGCAIVYTGALYYAMAVGNAEVAAGGKHEALVGVGFLLGPSIGFLAASAVEAGWIAVDARDLAIAVPVAAIAVLGFVLAWRSSRRS